MANIKFKKILEEAAWDHTSGKKLPTLDDVQKAYNDKKHLNEESAEKGLKAIPGVLSWDIEQFLKKQKDAKKLTKGSFTDLVQALHSRDFGDRLNGANLKNWKAVVKKHIKESKLNESEYVVIDPRGNSRPAGNKIQASQYVKKMGGGKKGYFMILKKNALKARRALEKARGNHSDKKYQDKMSDMYWEGVVNEGAGDNKTYTWGQINKAFMAQGTSPKNIAKFLSVLKKQ